jgi:hypothetical protein
MMPYQGYYSLIDVALVNDVENEYSSLARVGQGLAHRLREDKIRVPADLAENIVFLLDASRADRAYHAAREARWAYREMLEHCIANGLCP